MNPQSVLTMFQRSGRVMLMNLDGLTPANAFWTPAPNVNSINWLLGHCISARTSGTRILGQSPVWEDAIRARYRGGSEPITGDGDGVLDLMRLLFDFAESQRRLEAGLTTATSEDLAAPSEFEQFGSVGDYLLYVQTHEMNHAGHIMVVRELLGLPSHWA